MARLSRFEKDAVERLRYIIDYSRWLDTDEVLSDFAITISPTTDPVLRATGAVASGDLLRIQTFLEGGKRGETYMVAFVATTSQGQIKRDDIEMRVR